MKIRIKGNSIRLRLTQSEVKSIGDMKTVTEQLNFPGDKTLNYELSVIDNSSITCSFTEDKISVSIPKHQAFEWAGTDKISIETALSLTGDDKLLILIEKDFACLSDRPHEDESDMFPNPNETC